ncbi:MAG: hypothetical protein FJX18_02505 [Alphaproteobacteria bacterium]|nr:hypothetical protein [Alphaproteobacteria bacterium]
MTKYLSVFLLLINFSSVANAHCSDRANKWDCERFNRCYWGAVGCTSKKNLQQKKSSVLNYLGFDRD